MSVAILAFMILVTIIQFATKYPYLPVTPNPAGKLYYLADSEILADFQDASTLTQSELVRQADRETRYSFGTMRGKSGELRIGVDHARRGWSRKYG
jgi:hypothetical protein